MITLSRLQETERHVLSYGSEREVHDGYAVARCDRWPDWYQANHLEILRAGERDLRGWLRVFERHFPARRYRHVMLHLPSVEPHAALIAEARERTDLSTPLLVEPINYRLATRAPQAPMIPDGLVVSALSMPRDRERLLRFSIREAREEPWFRGEARVRKFLERRQEISDAAGVRWHALHRPGETEILARLGVFRHREIARLQSVGTAPPYRRRGYAAALLRQAIHESVADGGAAGLAVASDPDTTADRLYARLGFDLVGTECWMMRYP